MHSVVCIKQVPDTAEVRVDPKTGTLIRKGVPSIANPFDMHALEEALRVKDKAGGKVTVISMGPAQASDVIKKAISLGADQGILLCDVAFAGSDTLATSYILSQAIRQIDKKERVNLVFCGKMAIDGDTAQVGPGMATRLGYGLLTYVFKIDQVDAKGGLIRARRKLEQGEEVVEAKLPALLTIVKEANEPRYASLPDLISSIRYEPVVWKKEAFQLDLKYCGLKGSPTQVKRISPPAPRDITTELIPDGETDPEKAAKTLAGKLINEGIFGDGHGEG